MKEQRDKLHLLNIPFIRTLIITFNSNIDDCSNAFRLKIMILASILFFLYGKYKWKKTKQGTDHYKRSIACWKYTQIPRFEIMRKINRKITHIQGNHTNKRIYEF